MKIGFIGLGQMGKGMAANIIKSNEEITVYDVVDKEYQYFRDLGAYTASDISEMCKMDIVFLCLPNEVIVEKVLFGEQGILKLSNTIEIIVDCSTINYLSAVRIAKSVEDMGIKFIDAPVSGMQAKAEDGTLSIMCGGEEETYKKVENMLKCMGTNILYLGKHGNGQLAKMVNNCLYDINCVAFEEMLAFSTKLGLDPEKIGKIINSSTGKSYASDYFLTRILNREFNYGFTLKAAYKDVVSAVEVASHENIPTPMLDSMASIYKMALNSGYGDMYKGAYIKVYEDILKIVVKK